MAGQDDKESKTEEATEKKIRDALEKGNVPFSKELATFASLVSLLIVMSFFAVDGVLELTASLERFIDDPGRWSLENSADAIQVFGAINLDAVQLLAPAILALAAAGMGSSMVQNSPRIVFHRIQPQLSRLSITSGWRRIFGLQGWVEFLKGAFKLAALAPSSVPPRARSGSKCSTRCSWLLCASATHADNGRPPVLAVIAATVLLVVAGSGMVAVLLAAGAQDDAPGDQRRAKAARMATRSSRRACVRWRVTGRRSDVRAFRRRRSSSPTRPTTQLL
jgi:hypothetical protein